MSDSFSQWVEVEVEELLKKAVESNDDSDDDDESNDDVDDGTGVFRDHIESGEQGSINGKEPGAPVVPLV